VANSGRGEKEYFFTLNIWLKSGMVKVEGEE